MSTTMDGRFLRGLRISGSQYSGQLEHVTTSVGFSMSVDQVTQMSFNFLDDHALTLFRSRLMDKGASISYGEWSLTVDKVDLSSGDAGPELAVSALSAYVYRWRNQHGAKTWTNVDVAQWFHERCREVGATAIIQPGLGRKTIVRESSLEMGFQDTWEVMAQVRRELGVWMFERGRDLVVGRPSWIISQHQHFQHWPLWWNSWTDYHQAFTGMPNYVGRTENASQEELSFQLVAPDADKMRPGDSVHLGGLFAGAMVGNWLVASVRYPMNAVGPVSVTCVRAIDPAKEESTPTSGLGAAPGAATGAAAYAPGANDTTTINLSTLPSAVAGYSGQQIINAAHIIRSASAMGLPKRAAQIAVMVAITESTLRVLNYGPPETPDARGVFQQAEAGWGSYTCRMDPTCSANSFFQKLRAVAGWNTMAPADAALAVQVNPTPADYNPSWSAAVKIVDAILATATAAHAPSAGSGGAPVGLSSIVDRYVHRVLGLAVDVDGKHGAQCVDLTQHYTTSLGGPSIYGNGRDWWVAGRESGFFNAISTGSTAHKGDIACWSASMGGGWGHVAIVLQDSGPTLRCLTQNPGPPSILNLTKNNVTGYLRPKTWK